jgi:hypothetical protein
MIPEFQLTRKNSSGLTPDVFFGRAKLPLSRRVQIRVPTTSMIRKVKRRERVLLALLHSVPRSTG